MSKCAPPCSLSAPRSLHSPPLATTASGASHSKSAVSGNLVVRRHLDRRRSRRTSSSSSTASRRSSRTCHVKYTSGGDNTPTDPVDGDRRAAIRPISRRSAQPGLVKQFAARQAIKPIDVRQADDVRELRGLVGHARHVLREALRHGLQGRQQVDHLVLDLSAFKNAGIKPPKTWAELLTAAKTLRASGTKAYSIAGADGWTLTDLFENIYLRQAGPAKYDKLAAHTIKWTDPSVKTALKTMAQIFSDTGNIYGGTSRRAADRLPDLGEQRLQPPAEGRDGDGGRLRARRVRPRRPSRSRTTTSSRSRRSTARRAVGRRRRRHRRDVQGHARRPALS